MQQVPLAVGEHQDLSDSDYVTVGSWRIEDRPPALHGARTA
jgi:hypothetical protein